jgi:glycosyltransferase involved in cell wall biosynthesis
MNSAPPKVSVCIPTYAGEKYLGAAIESVLGQTFKDFELLVIDDNSPNSLEAFVQRYSDPRIRFHRNATNLRPEGNWNRCLELSSGEYFKLLPHDDTLTSDCLHKQVSALDSDKSQRLALVYCARSVIGPDGRKIMRRDYPQDRDGLVPAGDVVRACVRKAANLIGEPGAVLFRKSLAERVGRFDATNPYVLDLNYWFRLLEHGDAYYCREELATFRVSTQSWSVAIGSGQVGDFSRFIAGIGEKLHTPTTPLDRACGQVMARLNSIGRLIFYRVYLR